MSDQLRSGQVCQGRSGRVVSCRVGSGRVESSRIGSDQVRLDPVNTLATGWYGSDPEKLFCEIWLAFGYWHLYCRLGRVGLNAMRSGKVRSETNFTFWFKEIAFLYSEHLSDLYRVLGFPSSLYIMFKNNFQKLWLWGNSEHFWKSGHVIWLGHLSWSEIILTAMSEHKRGKWRVTLSTKKRRTKRPSGPMVVWSLTFPIRS